jgi:cytochrome c oxidase subunit 2
LDAAPTAVSRRALYTGVATAALVTALDEGTARAGTFLPERGGSPNADRIANLYLVVLILAALVFIGVAVGLGYSLIRYRERRNKVPVRTHGNTRLEIGWTAAAAALIVFLAIFSLFKLDAIENPDRSAVTPAAAAAVGIGNGPDDALRIRVIGRQYVWEYHYPNGAYSYEEMVAPVGVTVKLDIVSRDVAHSWWIPKLGGKLDAIPGYVNHTWFRLTRAGVFRGQCAELCGRNHANMLASVRGVTPQDYARWVARQKRLVGAEGSRGSD